jgi:hypothetical protein
MTAISAASPERLAGYQRAGDAATVRVEAAARYIEAALGPFRARCVEYPLYATEQLEARLFAHALHESELVGHVAATARAFQAADSGWLGLLLPGLMRAWRQREQRGRDAPRHLSRVLTDELHRRLVPNMPEPSLTQIVAGYKSTHWNRAALRLIIIARSTNQQFEQRGSRWPLALPQLVQAFALPSVFCGAEIASLIVVGDLLRWGTQPIDAPNDLLYLTLQGLWYESMAHIDPRLFQALSAELDRLNLQTCAELGRCAPTGRPEDHAERVVDAQTGALDVTVGAVFELSGSSDAPFAPQVAESMRGDHSAISYQPGEQVRLERLNASRGDYRISIAGLDPQQPGALNNFEAVALTAGGVAEGNHYYEEVRARFLADLERIPPGSVLHLQGHSMGGGMCMLLRDDPLVQAQLSAAGVVVGSLITFGAVRPAGPAGADQRRARGDPFAHAEERHYVNSDDSLARNVGAGHAGRANVILLDNGAVDEPAAAHGNYDDPEIYAGLPPELQRMPFEVDPESHTVYAPLADLPRQADE